MNGIWQGITQTIGTGVPLLLPITLAQTPVRTTPTFSVDTIIPTLGSYLGTSILNLAFGILALLLGLVVASIASRIVEGLLKRTNLDNRIASWVMGSSSAEAPPVEKWVSSVVFWLIMLFAIVAFLQAIQLTAVSGPLNSLLDQVTRFLPKLGGAALLLLVAWVLATIIKLVVSRTLRAVRLDERLGEQVGDRPSPNQFLLSETVANTLYWFIFLLFLPSVLSTLELQGTLQPVQQLVNQILSILPNIFAAVLIAAAGWLVAQVVRRIVTNLLAATGTDRLGTRFGISQATGGQSLSWLIGTIVYVLILIPTAIAALEALRIDAISRPAISMLTQILNTIPQILTAALILAIAYFIGKFIADLVTNILTSIGFNNVFSWLGLQPRVAARLAPARDVPLSGEPTVLQTPPPVTTRTPSEIVGIVVLVGIMLLATVAATDVLKIPALTAIITGIVRVLGRILGGLVVFAIGLYLANLAFNLITSSGTPQARLLGQTARIGIIILVSAMALQQMRIASDIINLAFGLLLGAIAVAIALAFGLGSRDIAAQQVRDWLGSFKDDRTPRL